MSTARVISEHNGGSRNFTSDAAQFMSDEALVAGAKMGHGSFFDELHERHRERMFRVAHRITRDIVRMPRMRFKRVFSVPMSTSRSLTKGQDFQHG
jgi:hypothetical protein